MTLKAPNFLAYGAAFVSGGAYGGPPMGRKNRKTQDETAKFFFGRYAPETHTFVNRGKLGVLYRYLRLNGLNTIPVGCVKHLGGSSG